MQKGRHTFRELCFKYHEGFFFMFLTMGQSEREKEREGENLREIAVLLCRFEKSLHILYPERDEERCVQSARVLGARIFM